MRIISGKYGGRVIKAPHGHKTHPMSEKIRGAIFNALGDIDGLKFLDAFSGTGAIAIEAISRGADYVVAIDSSKEANRAISDNIKDLNIKNIKSINANVSSWSDNNSSDKFDIVVCDPPYDHVQISVLVKLETHVRDGGLLVLSLPPGVEYDTNFTLLLEKDYNDAKLYIYRNNK